MSHCCLGQLQKPKNPAEEAAALGLYGPLTRSVENFYPSRLLCKRFNVKPPSHVQGDSSGETSTAQREGASEDRKGAAPNSSATLPRRRLELVGKEEMDKLRANSSGGQTIGKSDPGAEQAGTPMEQAKEIQVATTEIDPERNEALEAERPGEAVFKAIFGSDSEDD